jgi:nicotinamidase-related amidase
MKKIICLAGLIILAAMTPDRSFSQEPQEQQTGIKPALLIIDIQNAFLTMVPEKEKELALYYINGYIELFRSHGFPVIRIYHHSKEYGVEPGTDLFEFPASVSIQPDDPMIVKTYPDGFNKTDLDEVLREEGSNTLFLCGLSAVGCVLATWIGAQNHDYNAFILKDAIMSHNEEFTNNVEVMFDAVGSEVVTLILENSVK